MSADKGGGIVLLNRSDYLRESYRLLSDRATYAKLKKDPTAEFALEADTLINTALKEDIITKTESSFLRKSFYQIPFIIYPRFIKV